ncbi:MULTISPECIES: glycohydrolase toxin TNT-related protein [unclassified Curtobacterium]|uniref:glycohydrolase toxin TNT-related protein n=1 Tax=unclassified Curtobacterium TaxID=257496 RepID=UPI003821DEB3
MGSVFDRFGPENGRFTSPVPESGPYPYDERSLPYLEDASQYHQYRVVGDFNRIEDYVMRAPEAVRQDVLDLMETKDLTWEDLSHGYRGNIADGFHSTGDRPSLRPARRWTASAGRLRIR